MATDPTRDERPPVLPTLRVCVGNLKGGAGKTTTAVLLALGLYLQLLALFARLGRAGTPRVLLVDCDPEQSQALDWSHDAGKRWPAAVDVIHVRGRDVAGAVDDYLQHVPGGRVDAVVFDIGPKNPAMLASALRVCAPMTSAELAGQLVIPVRPTGGDMRELGKVLQVAADVDGDLRADVAGIAPRVLLTQVRSGSRPGTGEEAEARAVLADPDNALRIGAVPVFTARVRMLRRWALAFGTVPDDARALADYWDVTAEVLALAAIDEGTPAA